MDKNQVDPARNNRAAWHQEILLVGFGLAETLKELGVKYSSPA